MREILFRGKRTDNGEWVYGYVGVFKGITQIFVPFTEEEEKENEGHIFSCIGGLWYTVNPETVGQFTGLTDKNGKKFFVGDVIKTDNGKQKAISVVKYGNFRPKMIYHMFRNYIGYEPKQDQHGVYCETEKEQMMLFDSPACIEVIGNIHDNPEPPKEE